MRPAVRIKSNSDADFSVMAIGRPRSERATTLQTAVLHETIVVAHHEVRFHLLNGIERNAHHNQHRLEQLRPGPHDFLSFARPSPYGFNKILSSFLSIPSSTFSVEMILVSTVHMRPSLLTA